MQLRPETPHAPYGIAPADREPPEILGLMLAGVVLKKPLRLVFRDHPIDDDLIAQGVPISEARAAIEADKGRTIDGAGNGLFR